jgi:hypothetical protein
MGLLREHWRLAGELLCLLLLAGTTWQAFHREPAPAIHEKIAEHAAETSAVKTDVHEDVGGWSISTYEYAPEGAVGLPGSHPPMAGSAASPDTMIPHGDLVKLIVERHDPTVIATHSTEQVQAEQDRHLELTVAPQPQPGWAVQAGMEDLLGDRRVRLAARRRLFGPLWAEFSVTPAHLGIGLAVAAEW